MVSYVILPYVTKHEYEYEYEYTRNGIDTYSSLRSSIELGGCVVRRSIYDYFFESTRK